jgi:hypothetical protein
MNIIRDTQTFTEELQQLKTLVQLGARLPTQVFTDCFSEYLFFSYDRLLFDTFWEFVTQLLNKGGETSVTWMTLDPDPVEYFFRHFGHYGCARLSATDSKQDYLEFLTYSTDGNPAEALIHRPIIAALFPADSKWCVYADGRAEIGAIAFKDNAIKEYVAANPTNGAFVTIVEALEKSIDYGFGDRALSTEAKRELVRNFTAK